ncbi:endogenous retrovirus group S71 member 1 Env polyprotein-like [Pteropus vampyrus]|uniref:Endogenous retrovirus group S71 member 1 Env polyprotein-like n=1 Tax=Pteropus vampyrus TaxID=132908 RepID=A0A6P6C5U2_PTEVA|nr:endogenous retrovirus group S71 member 1 Env polyprotein-like [Pteropus vampyrus]
MESNTHRGSTQDKTLAGIIVLGLVVITNVHGNPHQPQQAQWELIRSETGISILVNQTMYQPTFHVGLCNILGEELNKQIKEQMLAGSGPWWGCGVKNYEKGIQQVQLYMCSREDQSTCNKPNQYYCGHWGCETIAPWKNTDPFLTLTRPSQSSCATAGKCNPVVFTVKNWEDPSWVTGKTWGLRLYVSGDDPGMLMTIQKKPVRIPSIAIGPVGSDNEGLKDLTPTQLTTIRNTNNINKGHKPRQPYKPPRGTPDSILTMLNNVYKFANDSNSNATKDCWFCLNPAPPYYVGLGVIANLGTDQTPIRNVTSPNVTICPWGTQNPSVTLGDLQGKGTCIYTNTYRVDRSRYKENCKSSILVNSFSPTYLAAPSGTWFACNTGLTACINLNYWKNNTGFCVLVHVIPQVYMMSGQEGRQAMDLWGGYNYPRRKRAIPVLVPLLVGLGVAGSAAVGTAALVTGNQGIAWLTKQINDDLSTLEKSINHLETSLNSLAEVVLQNRRGLDLLFLKQGGLCVALGETCCFFVNHSGIIRDSLALIRQRVKDRNEKLRQGSNWYESWFNENSWLTMLLSAIAGPLIMLILLLIFGPCLLKWLRSLVQSHMTGAKILILGASAPTSWPRIPTSDSKIESL